MAQNAKTIVTIKLEPETKQKLAHLGKVKTRSSHWLMKQAILEYVNKEELAEKLRNDTIERWKEAEAGHVIDNNQVLNWLRSWGKEDEEGSL